MSDEVVFYRADIQGLKPNDATLRMVASYDGNEYTYATTSLDVARAFAVFAFGVPRDHERSVYRVELDDPIVLDPEFRSDEAISFVMSHWGTVLDVVDEKVATTVDEARRIMSRYGPHWMDKSLINDEAGNATLPPKSRNDSR